MIIKTAGSIYEVDESRCAFRRIHQFDDGDPKMPIGVWCRYQRIGPVVVGEPVRFFWVNGEEAGLTRIGLWSSSPVVEVLSDESSEDPMVSPRPELSAPDGAPLLLPERRARERRAREGRAGGQS